MKWQIDFGNRPWRRWFAWYPVRLQSTETRVWLEYVERRTENIQGYFITHYRRGDR